MKLGRTIDRFVHIIRKASWAFSLQMIIVILFLYIYAIFGMQLFAGKLRFGYQFQLDLVGG